MPEIKIPELSELKFEERTHTYRLDGVVIPSVTTIMQPLSADKYSNVFGDVLQKAADKGTEVHNAIECWLKYGIEDISEENRPYFEAFLKWQNLYKPEIIGSEIRLYHKILGYAGTTDLLARIDGEIWLIDYKTVASMDNKAEKLYDVQLEAYKQALESHEVKADRKMILWLKKDKEYKEIECPQKSPQAWRVFTSCKCIYDYTHMV